METKIKVIVKRPDEKAGHVTWMSNSLKAFQSAVDGYIECVTIEPGLVVICNEEGRLRGLEPNCWFGGHKFVGTIIIAGARGEEFADVPISLGTFKACMKEARSGSERRQEGRHQDEEEE